MALVTQSANLVRQKAYNAVYGTGTGTSADSVSPYHFYAIKQFFLHWAMNHGNADLQFIPYSAEDSIVNHGTALMDAACTLYVWFGKARRTTATTDAFETLYNAAAIGGDSDVIGDEITIQRINLTGQQFLNVHPNGWIASAGIVIQSTTAVEGASESTAALSTDGFIIVGA
jgi:hypothetical protein